MLSACVNRIFSRPFLFILLLVFCCSWLLFGNAALRDLGDENSKIREYVARQIEQLTEADPEAGASLAAIARDRDIRAVASSLRMYNEETNGNPVHSLARDMKRDDGEKLRWYTLSAVGMENYAGAAAHEREDFLVSYGAVYQNTLELDPTGKMTAEFASALASAPKNGRDWSVMASDPAALAFHGFLKNDPASWKYFTKEREWLADVLVSLPVPEDEPEALASGVLDAVQTARRYDPVFKNTYLKMLQENNDADPTLGCALLDLFGKYGDFLAGVDEAGISVEEMSGIIYANPMEFEFSETSTTRAKEIGEKIKEMQFIKLNKPSVWLRAAEEMNFLWLEQAAPEQAEWIAETYPGGDIPTLIFTYYEEMAATAAQAIVMYGELGIYMLNRYREDTQFLQSIANPKIGIRVIPFITRFPEDGLNTLQNDTAWVDKYFNPDGSAKDQGWVKDIPLVGGPANVVGNWLDGTPNTWGEIGWAVFDAVDCAATLATFGAATGVSQEVKQAAKASFKLLTRTAKATLGVAGRRIAREAAEATGKYTVRALLVRVVSAGYRSIRWGARTTISFGGSMLKAAGTAWRGTPPAVRRLAVGTVAVSMFYYSFTRRETPAAIRKALEGVGTTTGKMINAVGTGVAGGLVNAVNETLDDVGRRLSDIERLVCWIFGAAAFAAGAYFCRPSRLQWDAFRKGV